jgi:cytochrome c-type biogenesis protein CcmF
LALTQSLVPLMGAHRSDFSLMTYGRAAAVAQFLFLALSFGCLMMVFITSDFSVKLVASHSNSIQPMLYKISATWGNHEGSMLLWVLILALFGALVALFGEGLRPTLQARVLAIQALVGVGFLGFILFTSNPFERLVPAAIDGAELNPLLQDPGLAFHPPLLYVGYVGFSMAFSFAIAALIEGRVDAAWARWVRPWVMVSWVFLTLGIAAGSWWAYYELGWGGWWYWDPVENASFMPWLMGTALLHSALVVERRHALVSWTILLAILTFGLSMLGTFLVRSGILTSVHAFAVDPERGVFILGMLAVYTGGALALFALRAPALKSGTMFSTVSRESSLVANNMLLVSATATVFLGTFYPVIYEAFAGDKISVGPPYFNATFVPIMLPLMVLMVVGPVLKWKRDQAGAAFLRLKLAGIVSVLAGLAVLGATMGQSLLAALGVAVSVWMMLGSLAILARRARLFQAPLDSVMRSLRTTPRSVYGLVLAHFGMGVTALGITAISAWTAETVVALKPNERATVGRYEVIFRGISDGSGPNYAYQRAHFDVLQGGTMVGTIDTEKRFYPITQNETTEAGIRPSLLGDLYIALGDRNAEGGYAVRLYDHPLSHWLWVGCLIMAAGGVLSLTDRRFRLGAAERARARPAPSQGGRLSPVPAE